MIKITPAWDEILKEEFSSPSYQGLREFLKTEYSKGKFFIQPQVLFDYYFPAKEGNFSTAFLLNAGVIF